MKILKSTGIPIIVANEILLGLRLDGTWDIVGFGGLGERENPYEGEKRELKEENLCVYNLDNVPGL